jgi:hypothetical protein
MGIACGCELMLGVRWTHVDAAYSVTGSHVQPGDVDSGGPGVLVVAVCGLAVAVQAVEGLECTRVLLCRGGMGSTTCFHVLYSCGLQPWCVVWAVWGELGGCVHSVKPAWIPYSGSRHIVHIMYSPLYLLEKQKNVRP